MRFLLFFIVLFISCGSVQEQESVPSDIKKIKKVQFGEKYLVSCKKQDAEYVISVQMKYKDVFVNSYDFYFKYFQQKITEYADGTTKMNGAGTSRQSIGGNFGSADNDGQFGLNISTENDHFKLSYQFSPSCDNCLIIKNNYIFPLNRVTHSFKDQDLAITVKIKEIN